MCDTMVVTSQGTPDSSVILAKNSDREPNEAQELVIRPTRFYPDGSRLRCTHLEIAQARETYAVLLAKPFWIWGAEMGFNEQGLAVGNEALFTRYKSEKSPGLIGMDLVRLALERAATAVQAVELISDLIERHGQSGRTWLKSGIRYDNSFICADPAEAWVLETVGRQWAARRIEKPESFSNAITTEGRWDLASEGLVDFCRDQGFHDQKKEFNFSKSCSDYVVTRFSDARSRRNRAMTLLAAKPKTGVSDLMAILRDHGPGAGPGSSPGRGLTGCQICMHAGFGPIRRSQTVGSLTVHLTDKAPVGWVTGTSAPCTGVFKPVWLDAGLPELGPSPTDHHDETTLWWDHERWHRRVIHSFPWLGQGFNAERDRLEAEFVAEADKLAGAPAAVRLSFTTECFQRAAELTGRWAARLESDKPAIASSLLHRRAWKSFNRQAGLDKSKPDGAIGPDR